MLFYSRVLQHSSYDCMEDIYVSLPHTVLQVLGSILALCLPQTSHF